MVSFIKMGVDGFRIDTSGHISRLTFNHQFVPQFAALGKQYENKRLNKAPFFMYGEVCTRGTVMSTYRGQDNLSCYLLHMAGSDEDFARTNGMAAKVLLGYSQVLFAKANGWYRCRMTIRWLSASQDTCRRHQQATIPLW